MYSIFDFNPVAQMSDSEQIELNRQLKANYPCSNSIKRDLTGYFSESTWLYFETDFNKMSNSEKVSDLWESVCELVIVALKAEEGFKNDTAQNLIKAAVNESEYMKMCQEVVEKYTPGKRHISYQNIPIYDKQSRFSVKIGEETVEYEYIETAKDLVKDLAGLMYLDITKTVFTAGVDLNLQTYRYIFPTQFTVHDPELIVRKITNSNYKMSEDEIKNYLTKNSDKAFPIMNAFSIKEVLTSVESGEQTLQSAGRYQNLKRVFDNLKDELVDESQPIETPKVTLSLSQGDAGRTV